MTRFHSVFNFVFSLVFVLQISPLFAGNVVPVLLWTSGVHSDSETGPVSPFLQTSPEEFESLLHTKIDKAQSVLVYVKDNLCVEDFSQHKEHLQQAINGSSLDYLPAVEKPLTVLMDLSSYNQTYNDDLDSISNRQLIVKSINDLSVIPETYRTIKDSSPNLIAVLTGKSCSYRRSERVKRETAEKNNSDAFIIRSERILLYAKEPPRLKISADNEIVLLPSKLVKNETRGEGTEKSPLILYLQFSGTSQSLTKIILWFIFEVKTTGYYTLKTVNYRENDINNTSLTTNTEIVFPFTFSYHCSQSIIFQNDSVSLNITNMQVQVDAKSFGDAYDCIGFTTIPIWTGIFVTAILAIIMIWALTMIIDIRTMDRFDDPKGKTITISSQE